MDGFGKGHDSGFYYPYCSIPRVDLLAKRVKPGIKPLGFRSYALICQSTATKWSEGRFKGLHNWLLLYRKILFVLNRSPDKNYTITESFLNYSPFEIIPHCYPTQIMRIYRTFEIIPPCFATITETSNKTPP